MFVSKTLKISLVTLAVFLFVFVSSQSLFAASEPGVDATPERTAQLDANTQSQGTASSQSSGASGESGGLYSAIGGTAACSAGQILGRIVGSAVSQAISGMTRSLTNSAVSAVRDVMKVPTIDQSNLEKNRASAENTAALRNKTVGGGNPGGGILSGIVNSINSISWDSIMYCIVNEIMTYITQSTIQWINSGFNGNPVFVQNISAKFQQIGDREASNFMREIQNGASSGARQAQNIAINGVRTSAFTIAAPLRQGALKAILGSSQDTYQNRVRSTLSPQLTQNYSKCVGGDWYACGGFSGLMQVSAPNNNEYGVRWATIEELERRKAEAQMVEQSRTVNGTQSFYKCRAGAKLYADGGCAPRDQVVTTPAQYINDETNSRNGMKYLRLSFAKDFDSVVTALVNQLVKIAVNKAYEAVQ